MTVGIVRFCLVPPESPPPDSRRNPLPTRVTQFRPEFFNALNQVNLGIPNSESEMGRITSAGGARVIQFALKVVF